MADTFNNDSSGGYDCEDFAPLSPTEDKIQRFLPYFILVFGVTANGAVLSVIAFTRELRTASNIYIVVLCGANLAMLVTFLPLYLVNFGITTNGVSIANLINYGLQFQSNLSILALMILSFDRWRVIVRPLRAGSQSTKGHIVQLIIVFATAVVITLPFAFSYEERKPENGTNETEAAPSDMRGDYLVFTTYYGAIFLYLIPLGVIGGFYISTAARLLSHSDMIRKSMRRYKKARTRRSRVAWVVLGLVFSFALCWLPHYLFLVLHVTESFCTSPKLINFLIHWKLLVLLFNTCTDPFCVFLLGSKFRRHLIRGLHLGCICGLAPDGSMYRGNLNGTTMTSSRPSGSAAMKLQPVPQKGGGAPSRSY